MGVAAFVLATAGFLAASLVNVPWPAIFLELSALGVVGWGIKQVKKPKDRIWLHIAGGIAGLVLLLALVFPSALNSRWALHRAVEQVDPEKQVAVPHSAPRAEGKTLAPKDWATAETDAIRQTDLLVSLEMAVSGSFGKKGSFGQIHCEFANLGGGVIAFKGFDGDKHVPTLSDDKGRTFAFVEQRLRIPAKDVATFQDSPKTGGMNLAPAQTQGVLLLFEPPPAAFKTLKLELPGSAWGKPGVFRFVISGPFSLD